MYPVTFFKTTIPNKHKHINKILVEFHWTQRRKSPVCRSLHKHLLFMSCPALSGGVLLFVYGVLLPVQVVVCCCCQLNIMHVVKRMRARDAGTLSRQTHMCH